MCKCIWLQVSLGSSLFKGREDGNRCPSVNHKEDLADNFWSLLFHAMAVQMQD